MQNQIHFSGNTVYWKTRKLGTIYPSEHLFLSVQRSRTNLFRMFNGLGINEELLLILKDLDIKYIEVPFCGEILKTTTAKWLRKGIPSPYVSARVDQQLILSLSKINFDEMDIHKVSSTQEQLSLFRSA